MARTLIQEELVEEILVRLPVKSLMRLKCVCKPYLSLITNNRFITKHFTYSIAKNQPSLIVFHSHNNRASITLVPNDNLSQPHNIRIRPPSPYSSNLVESIKAYGPCNGIFCLQVSHVHTNDRLMLWNLATREVKDLPLPHHVSICEGEYFEEVNGFGIDPITSDYKVVNLGGGVNFGPKVGTEYMAQVYNLSTNLWNIIDVTVFAYEIVDSPHTSYLNGVYHWLIREKNEYLILCFNMSNNTFQKMKLPPVFESDTGNILMYCNIAIIEDFVACVKEYKPSSLLSTCVEIWVMNDYGVAESWTKRFNIEPHLEQWKFWGFWKDDAALITEPEDNLPLVSYNKVNAQHWEQVVPIRRGVIHHALTYVESLVPLSLE